MKKLLLATTAIAVMMGSVSSAASSSLAYETRLAQKETLEAAGKKYYGDVAGDGWSTCISGLCFIGEDTLTPGTLKPAVTNARDLLLASKAVGNDVLVASADNSFVFVKSPFIEELAEQNSVSYEYMASLLWDHSVDAPTNADGETVTWQEAMQAETVKIAAMADLISNGEAGFDYEGGYAELQSVIEMLEADAVGNAVAIEALNTKIAELESNAEINAASITNLKLSLGDWESAAKAYTAGMTAGAASVTPEDGITQTDVDAVSYEITINGEAKTISKDGEKTFIITTEDGHHSTVTVTDTTVTVTGANPGVYTLDPKDGTFVDDGTAATEAEIEAWKQEGIDSVKITDFTPEQAIAAFKFVLDPMDGTDATEAEIKAWIKQGVDSVTLADFTKVAAIEHFDIVEEDGVNNSHVSQAFKNGVNTVRTNVDKIAEKYGVATGNAAGTTANALYNAGYADAISNLAGNTAASTGSNGGGFGQIASEQLTDEQITEAFNNSIAGAYAGGYTGILSLGHTTVAITDAIEVLTQAHEDAYKDGYEDGYNAGYADGYTDGVASTQ